jgi:hypothetical protein
MKLNVPISVGDYLDRLSILRIKSNNGLDVSTELNMYEELMYNLDEISSYHYTRLFITINECLWLLEDKKRNKDLVVGSEEYIEISELITHLNDLRYQIKKSVDKHFNSEIQERKSHDK